jgi:hypothetical protein
VSFAPAVTSPYGEALLALMKFYSWTSIAIINDRMTGVEPVGRVPEQCRAPSQQLHARRFEFNFLHISVDSSSENFKKALWLASDFTRSTLPLIVVSAPSKSIKLRIFVEKFELNGFSLHQAILLIKGALNYSFGPGL